MLPINRKLLIVFGILILPFIKSHAREKPSTKIIWEWADEFNADEKAKITEWLERTTTAVEETLGEFPFDLHFYIYRRDNSDEPVPWAHTERNIAQGVHFYVDPEYALQEFLNDWTAPHEISHLTIPYLGKKNAWFAEGYASFMQYQVMRTMGIYSLKEIEEKYASKLRMAGKAYHTNEDFVSVANNLRSEYKYPEMYWGGASFFLQLNKELIRQMQITLPQIIKEYMSCCRNKDRSLDELIESLDALVESDYCSELLLQYKQLPAQDIVENYFQRVAN